jgi:agmatinase
MIDPAHSIQIGIRTEYDPADHEFELIDARRANEQSLQATVDTIRARLGQQPA